MNKCPYCGEDFSDTLVNFDEEIIFCPKCKKVSRGYVGEIENYFIQEEKYLKGLVQGFTEFVDLALNEQKPCTIKSYMNYLANGKLEDTVNNLVYNNKLDGIECD